MSIIKKNNVKSNNGFASIVVALILVLVFSLITLGFSQIARREQQNALNQQLSAKANYAAESSINKIVNLIKLNTPVPNSSNCSDTSLNSYRTQDSSSGLNTPCILVNTTPANYQSKIEAGSGKFFVIATSTSISSLQFEWISSNRNNTAVLANTNINPRNDSNYKSPSIVLLQITPISSVADYARDNLINNSFHGILYPTNQSDTINSSERGQKYRAQCSSLGKCIATVNIVTANKTKFLISAIAPYGSPGDSTILTVSAKSSLSPNPLPLSNTQAEIDVTAKSQDVLKRLKVRVPMSNNYSYNINANAPIFSLQAEALCKRIITSPTPTQATQYSDIADGSVVTGSSGCFLKDDSL